MWGFSAQIILVLFSVLFPGLNFLIIKVNGGGSSKSPAGWGRGPNGGYGIKMGAPTRRLPWIGISQIHQKITKVVSTVFDGVDIKISLSKTCSQCSV